MEFFKLSLDGLKLIVPKVFKDERGFFFEAYHRPIYQEQGIECDFVQDNRSFSKQGTIRGMHYQTAPGQAKLVQVIQGKIYDVVVDIRPDSSTFGKWEGVVLDDERHAQLYIPIGFAHGFCVLSETAQILYKVSSIYNPITEKGFRFDDPEIGIKWPMEARFLSSRDVQAPMFKEVITCTC